MKRITFLYAWLAIALLVMTGCSSDKKEGGEAAVGADAVQSGDPVLAAADGYVGSRRCGQCHQQEFVGWSKSLHNRPLKMVDELGAGIFVNDHDSNGRNDFEDGLDFNDPAFATKFGYANPFAAQAALGVAPRLSTGSKFFITIGSTTYEVQRTQGGNGYWKQRYHTKVGRSYYILPVQFDEKFNRYVPYSPANWYDAGNQPLYNGVYGTDALVQQFGARNNAVEKKGQSVSWENRCAGCHQAGLRVEGQTTSYGGTDVVEVVTGYVELNIGCENCHGPGLIHSQTANPGDIINPDNFRALGVTGLRVALQTCGSCHSRGESVATIPGMNLKLEYPSQLVAGTSRLSLPTPGVNVVDSASPWVDLNLTTAYYRLGPQFPLLETDPLLQFFTEYGGWYAPYVFPTYIASRQHHQAWTDMEQGPHAPDKDDDIACWDCHNPHKARGNPAAEPGDDHQIIETVSLNGVTVNTRDDNNTLCLACHAEFLGLTINDVRVNNTAAISAAVSRHMGEEAVMGEVPYNPAGTGVGRCSRCHMPKTAVSAVLRTAVGGLGLGEGDIHNHSFSIIWPSVNPLIPNTEMVSSCYAAGCHSNDPSDTAQSYQDTVTRWALSGHADFTGLPFRDFDSTGFTGTRLVCAKCHTRSGFEDYVLDETVNTPVDPGQVLSCGTCHTGNGTNTRWDERSTYVALDNVLFPSVAGGPQVRASLNDSSNICMTCHQGRESKRTVDNTIGGNEAGPFTFINIHYFAAAATFFGTDVQGSYEYAGKTYAGRFLHTDTRDTCIECHLGKGFVSPANHRFLPETGYCSECHPEVNTPSDPDNPFRDIRLGTLGIDFDGDGDSSEGIYFEIWDTLVPALLARIKVYAFNELGVRIAYDGDVYPYFFKDTNGNGVVDESEAVFANRYNLFDARLLRAAYNFQTVQKEPCGYIHNARYHIQILIDSIDDLGGDISDFTRPSANGDD